MTDNLPASFSLHAWVDESIHAPRGEQSGVYYLAAAVADPDECGSTREVLRGLVRRRHGRLHWRDELPDHISKAIRVDFAKPKDDPMLWVSDAVAGIVSLARRGRRLELRDALGRGVDEIAIDL